MCRVLIIEDEKNLARFIELELQYEGFNVATSYDGREGLDLALKEDWDIILLDLMLPGLSGMEVCRRIRAAKETPIIMLTARDSVMDKVSGLDSGADDYMSKPFAIEELLARIRALFRRMEGKKEEAHNILSFRELKVDLDARTVTRTEEQIELTKREFDLLVVFMTNINRVLTRELLLDKVWELGSYAETNVVDVYVRYLRNKIDKPSEESYIQTVRGTGYVMRK
ncbi:response regulator transcription factor [Sutcliffiella horikoshii]|uniref:DNA-binding response regulator n=1 Tax=Sutcliffiella horikoshii TaxID=79883 RepID=A0A1Y0CK30_9BACI|nr:response regulator transcription factor [Sutcliffiella horikoshii]ART75306.1 DNA-binding response regulator [Sutcliffiella horikoshii]TYS58681.1 response regulator transcription factor [Sutcliffiella horikoshii]